MEYFKKNKLESYHPDLAPFESAECFIKEMSGIGDADKVLRLQRLKDLEEKFFTAKSNKERDNVLKEVDKLTYPEYSHVTGKVSQDIE